jgi:hypothetical protein
MSPRTKPLTHADQIAKLDDATDGAKQRLRAVTGDVAGLAEKVQRLRQERVEAFAVNDEAAAERLAEQIAKHEHDAEDLQQRRAGAELAATRAQQARDTHVADCFWELVAERAPADDASVTRIATAVTELQAAVADYHRRKNEIIAFTRPAGVDPRAVPELDDSVNRLVGDLAAHVASIRPPRPGDRTPSVVTIEDTDSPDGHIAAAARAALTRSKGRP